MNRHTASLPIAYWTISLAGRRGLGLSDAAIADYAGELFRRVRVGCRTLGVVTADLPCFVPFHRGRKDTPSPTHPGRAVAQFDYADFERGSQLDHLLALASMLRFPMIVGGGFPPTADAMGDYTDVGLWYEADDSMGSAAELGAMARTLALDSGGGVIGEHMPLNNPDNWRLSTDIDREAVDASQIPWICNAGTFGRSVILKHAVQAPTDPATPIYLLVTGAANITAAELLQFERLGFTRYILQGVTSWSAPGEFVRRRFQSWLADQRSTPVASTAARARKGGASTGIADDAHEGGVS